VKRILTAVLILPPLYLYLTRLSEPWFVGLAIAAAVIGLMEFYSMTGLSKAMRAAAVPLAPLIIYISYKFAILLSQTLFAGFLWLVIVRLFLSGRPQGALRDVGLALTGLLYVPGMLSYQILLRGGGIEFIFLLYLVVWASDSLALYAGAWLGRRKLYPGMSPNKTVEGALGGLAGGVLAALLLNAIYGFMRPSEAVATGLLLSFAGQIGDLVESMFKRDAGVKDSGGIIPGHGGLLDKIDAALLGGPALYYILKVL